MEKIEIIAMENYNVPFFIKVKTRNNNHIFYLELAVNIKEGDLIPMNLINEKSRQFLILLNELTHDNRDIIVPKIKELTKRLWGI